MVKKTCFHSLPTIHHSLMIYYSPFATRFYIPRPARFPHQHGEPAGRGADEAAGDDVAEEVEVGAEEADDDEADHDRVERAPVRIALPQHRHGGAHRRGVPDGKAS